MPTQVEYGTLKKVDKKEVKYLGRDFPSIRQNLLEFAKAYFPNSYNDFNESSPGMMFIEMTAYVGDVLGFYIDNQYRESLLHAAEEKKNIFKIAQSFGYKPKLSSPSIAIGEFSIEVPATLDGGEYVPNTNYALSKKYGKVLQNMNLDTDGKLAKIFYTNLSTKYRFKNRELWQFKAVRQFKRAVAKTYPEQWPKYIVMESKKRVAHMYKNKE